MKIQQQLDRGVRLALVAAFVWLSPAVVLAQPSSSNYSLGEVFVGSGGNQDAVSASYSGRSSIGDLGVGYSESAAFQAFAGFTTTDAEYLEFYVAQSTIDLGVLDSLTTATASSNFYVRSYLSSGYTVQTVGQGFTNTGGYVIAGMSTNGGPAPGTEQFGMNLVANTSPVAFGVNPVQVPDASFSFGVASTNYNTTNSYRYVPGETIAESATSTGQTNYTASYIVDINPALTPSGLYTFTQDLIVTPTF